jgi:hypothetical protein
MAVGVGAVTYTLVGVISYAGKESGRRETAQQYEQSCKGDPTTHVFTSCTAASGLQPADGAGAYAAYNANEADAKSATPVWIVVGAVGALMIGGGAYLFATAPSRASEPAPSAARTRVDVHVVPRVGLHDSGLGVVGTF